MTCARFAWTAELVAAMEKAKDDCEKAGAEEKESEWHQACFAGAGKPMGEEA